MCNHHQQRKNIITTQTITLNIDGMTCGGCVKSVSNALKQVDGVTQADVSLEQNNAKISFDDSQTSVADLTQAVEDAGFEASV